MKKNIYIIYTGGTIGMVHTPNGYSPKNDIINQYLDKLAYVDELPNYTIKEYEPLLDSANMCADNWQQIADDLAANYNNYDGFVVLHGTDTMAYTASALPFLLRGLQKPVVVTGSQIPITKTRNDGHGNLISSLLVAANSKISEVSLLFGQSVLRGCRTVKVDASGMEAFESPNYPALATIGVDINIHDKNILATTEETFKLQQLHKSHVGILRLFPGITADYVRNVLREPLQGLILETYGQGNAPDRQHDLLKIIAEATKRGVLIVNCTQCLHGYVNQNTYAAGQVLEDIGVISGFDMTPSAALVKMYYLLGQDINLAKKRELMQTSLCGELTVAK
ncbi:MAG: asparaginase [Desulfotalea sp.]